MSNMEKKVSVIVTTYNHEKYIEECLDSIYKQTYSNIDLLIINDGSIDNSDSIIRDCLVKSPFENSDYISQENKGACVARNIGLDWAEGDFVLIVDSDNTLPSNYIEKAVHLLNSTNKDIAYYSLKNLQSKEVINEVPDFSMELFSMVNFIDTCSLIRRTAIGNNRFDLYLNRLFMQDYDFFLGLVTSGATPIKVKDVYLNYRVLENSQGNRGEDKTKRRQWFDVYRYISDKYFNNRGGLTNILAQWYDDVEEEKIELESELENLKKEKQSREVYLQAEIRRLNDVQRELVESTTWRAGKAVTFPFRKSKDLLILLKKAIRVYKISGISGVKEGLRKRRHVLRHMTQQYEDWIKMNEQPQLAIEKQNIEDFQYNPLISILIPVYNVDPKWLKECVKSIENQWYSNWEICIADDCSTNEKTINVLKEYEKNNSKIRVHWRKENGHISEATNSALEIASGEYIALVDNDDTLSENALYEVVKILNKDNRINMIYSDEDKINEKDERYDAHFKPDWSPDLILNQNYVSHLGVYRTEIAKNIGGFRKGFEGVQDHDFILRFTERIDSSTIYHIPKILYHWRAIEGSTALDTSQKDYAFNLATKMLDEAFMRRGIKAKARPGKYDGVYEVDYDIIGNPLVSIIIPTKNGYDDVKQCVDSIFEKSSYNNFEIILADNGSTDEKSINLFKRYESKYPGVFHRKVIDIPFNYSRINNLAVRESKGEYLIFLNNDTSIITENWIEKMLGFAQFKRIGCVGAKLWYFDNTIQHGGVIVGMGGVAGHSFINAKKDDPGYFRRLYVDYNYTAVTAACMMVSRDTFDLVGGFDESLEVAFNDVDFCIRVHNLGKTNVWAHEVELYHYESKSRGYEDTPEKQQRFNNEIKKMQQKHGESLFKDPAYNINFSLDYPPFTVYGR